MDFDHKVQKRMMPFFVISSDSDTWIRIRLIWVFCCIWVCRATSKDKSGVYTHIRL